MDKAESDRFVVLCRKLYEDDLQLFARLVQMVLVNAVTEMGAGVFQLVGSNADETELSNGVFVTIGPENTQAMKDVAETLERD